MRAGGSLRGLEQATHDRVEEFFAGAIDGLVFQREDGERIGDATELVRLVGGQVVRGLHGIDRMLAHERAAFRVRIVASSAVTIAAPGCHPTSPSSSCFATP